jgi:hypothetical protein
MHDGYYATLEDVIWHYNGGGTASGTNPFSPEVPDAGVPDGVDLCSPTGRPTGRAVQIKPLGLTDGDVTDLVEFLKTLTSTPIAPSSAFDAGAGPDVSATTVCASDGGGSQ